MTDSLSLSLSLSLSVCVCLAACLPISPHLIIHLFVAFEWMNEWMNTGTGFVNAIHIFLTTKRQPLPVFHRKIRNICQSDIHFGPWRGKGQLSHAWRHHTPQEKPFAPYFEGFMEIRPCVQAIISIIPPHFPIHLRHWSKIYRTLPRYTHKCLNLYIRHKKPRCLALCLTRWKTMTT